MNENTKLTKTAELVTDKDIGSNASPDVISLITPVVRDTETIKSVKIGPLARQAGSLRGLSLVDLYGMKFDALLAYLSRVTEPRLKESELKAMDARDFSALANAAVNFYVGGVSAKPNGEETDG
ncbi:TPA: hypothetical protein ACSEEH_003755 [Escherichia coli]